MMNTRMAFVLSIAVLLLVAAMASCTDTPPVSTSDCDDGEVFDQETEQCVAADNDDPENDAGPQEDVPDSNDNGDPGANDHPHANRDELDPYGDESGDGVPNKYDNCPYTYNPDQTDTAGDGIGDACDNCPNVANPDQEYSPDNPVDDRGIIMGDKCAPGVVYADTETDTSGDGVPDIMDNCPDHWNPPVDPSCTECPEDDPYCDECQCTCEDGVYPCDGCEQIDSSGDGVGDACDNCPDHHNPQQASSPGNPEDERGIRMGDACTPTPETVPICDEQTTEFEVMAPNVYVSFDLSGSMSATDGTGQTRIARAVGGLDLIAEELHSDIRFGLGTFPSPPDYASASCDIKHELDMGSHSESELKSTWANYGANGWTPMLASIQDIANNNRLHDPNDPHDDSRIKAILLVTDGWANCSDGDSIQRVTDQIADLYDNEGILTFVVGFELDDESLEGYAQAGGTGEHYLADDADELADAMRDVADLLVSCDYMLDTQPEDPDKIWINVDGEYLDPNDYSYDPSSEILTLEDDACDEVRQLDADNIEVEIEMGCATQCVPEEPDGLCDMWYETCGEEICDPCEPEVCDGTDNNCSGVVDDNCPDCAIYQAPCESDDDCCEPFVCNDDGYCDHDCYPDGAPCQENSDCCSDICSMDSGEEVGTCASP